MNESLGPTLIETTAIRRDIAVSLSGGGFRATAHHMGVLMAYLRYDLHSRVFIMNGVSGGAIASGHFGQWLARQQESPTPLAGMPALRSFIEPLTALMRSNLRRGVLLGAPAAAARGFFSAPSGSLVASALDRALFGGRALNKLTFPPYMVFTATELASASPFYLSAGGLGFRPRWLIERHVLTDGMGNLRGVSSPGAAELPAAIAVAVSACFPPVFRPIKVTLSGKEAEEYRSSAHLTRDSAYYRKFFQTHVSGTANRAAPIEVELLDGGVSDNQGIHFFADWLLAAKTHGDGKPPIRFLFAYDASQIAPLELTFLERHSRIKFTFALQDRIYGRRETVNDELVRIVSKEHGLAYGLHRAVPELAEDLGMDPEVLGLLLKVRTDLDRFSDTEIFCLAYCGFRLAEVGMSKHGLLPGELRSPAKTLEEFREITAGILSPLPSPSWRDHLQPSKSRLALRRAASRGISDLRRHFFGD